MEPRAVLGQLGLTEKEQNVYLELLRQGSATAHDLAKRTGILRQTVYDVLSILAKKGLVSQFVRRGVKQYEPVHPLRLQELLEQKRADLQQVMPYLVGLYGEKDHPSGTLYEGLAGVKAIYADILRTSQEELLEYGNAENFLNVLKLNFIENYIAKRKDRKIKLRLLVERTESTQDISMSDASLLRETRELPKLRNVKTINYLYADKYAIISLSGEPWGFLIVDETIASAQRVLFELLWGIAEPY